MGIKEKNWDNLVQDVVVKFLLALPDLRIGQGVHVPSLNKTKTIELVMNFFFKNLFLPN